MLRSLLFVPADRPERFCKAASSGADAIILDLEDSVALASKEIARQAVAEYLPEPRHTKVFVRVNPIESGVLKEDLAAIISGHPDAIVLPKAEGVSSVQALLAMMGEQRVPILPIATETPAAVFELGTYHQCREDLVGLTWGAEDLPAAIGASTSREDNGRYTAPYEMARSLTLFAAHRAQIQAIETVFPDIQDKAGLEAYVSRARRDGFSAMMAIHPIQVATINSAFTPTTEEIATAKAIVELFESNPALGVAQFQGRMVDRPHYKLAKSILARSVAGVGSK
jgi:citrate lyase subunit beta/citryl-CoA lyase